MESPFAHLLDLLTEIEDPRRAEGKLYKLPHVMLFSILAMMSGANSYRGIHSFIEVHLSKGEGRRRDAFCTFMRSDRLAIIEIREGEQDEKIPFGRWLGDCFFFSNYDGECWWCLGQCQEVY